MTAAVRTSRGETRTSYWLRVRQFAVPPRVIETATDRREAGDWAGACAAAGVDVELNLRAVARTWGSDVAASVRADLRALAPDLLRWHMPRIAPDGLLRPGLTIELARYAEGAASRLPTPLRLVARTPPAWADAGQRFALALWDGSRPDAAARRHPHPRPSRRFRLDLHRHLWDARRAGELRTRSGADLPSTELPDCSGDFGDGLAVHRWAAEAAILLRAEGLPAGPVAVRVGGRRRLLVEPYGHGVGEGGGDGDAGCERPDGVRISAASGRRAVRGLPVLPVLPDAATWTPPDLALLRAGLIGADALHPLVAAALAPDGTPARTAAPDRPPGSTRLVECGGTLHRIGLVDGVLTALDHDPDELRREELLVALTGTPLPCLRAIDQAHRRPDCLSDVRARLDHGDTSGAIAVVEALLGPGAVLRGGALRDELESDARRRLVRELFRSDLFWPAWGPLPVASSSVPTGAAPVRRRHGHEHGPQKRRPRLSLSHPRHAHFR